MAGASDERTTYHVCPHCLRATPARAGERYCPNDGTPMVTRCEACCSPLTSPYDRYCKECGAALLPTMRPGP